MSNLSQIEKDLVDLWTNYAAKPTYVSIGGGVNRDILKLEPPLNVVCPRCKASIGLNCKRKQLYPRPWGKKKSQRRAWEYYSEQIPHKERIRESKIKEVEDVLDGF